MEFDVEYSEETSFIDSPIKSPLVSQVPVLWIGSVTGLHHRTVPTVAFGIVKENQQLTAVLKVRNTRSYAVLVFVSDASLSLASELGLTLQDATSSLALAQLHVDPDEDALLTIGWSPQSVGSLQLTLYLEELDDGDMVISYPFHIVGCAVPVKDAIQKLSTFHDITNYQLKSPLSLKLKNSPIPADKENTIVFPKSTKSQKTPLFSRLMSTLEEQGRSPFSPSRRFEFVTRHELYDEQWMEKQEAAFTKWINFELIKWKGQVDSWTPHQRMACRKLAYKLFSSESIQAPLGRLAKEFDVKRIRIRTDVNFKLDIGLRSFLVELFTLNYDPLWLQLALETMTGKPVESDGCKQLLKVYLFESAGKEDATIVKRIFSLVLLCDAFMSEPLLSRHCCLFRKEGLVKSSKALLVSVGAKVLLGEGDLMRHLSYLGYRVAYTQSPLDEVEPVVHSLAIDLRDGLQLVRLLAALAPDARSLLARLKPQASMHNMTLLFDYFKSIYLDVSYGNLGQGWILPSDIVSGHREKTLALLWKIICRWKIPSLVDVPSLACEIQKLALAHSHEPPESISFVQSVGSGHAASLDYISLLFEWAWNVCAVFDCLIENFCSSFGDGRALCCILAYYQPALLAPAELTVFHGSYMELFHSKIGLLGGLPSLIVAKDLSGPYPDEKVVMTLVAYLSSRLFTLRRESQASSKIAKAWQRHHDSSLLFSSHTAIQRMKGLAVIIGRVQVWLLRRQLASARLCLLSLQSGLQGAVVRQQVVAPCLRALLAAQCFERRLHQQWTLSAQRQLISIVQPWMHGQISRAQVSRMRHGRAMVAYAQGHTVRAMVSVFRRSMCLLQKTIRANKLGKISREQTQLVERSIGMQSSLIQRLLASQASQRQRTAVHAVQLLSKGYLTRKSRADQQRYILACQSVCHGFLIRQFLQSFLHSLTCCAQGKLTRRRISEWCHAVTISGRSRALQCAVATLFRTVAAMQACSRRLLVQDRAVPSVRFMAVYVQSRAKSMAASSMVSLACQSVVAVQAAWQGRDVHRVCRATLDTLVHAQSMARGLMHRQQWQCYVRAKHMVQRVVAKGHIARHLRRYRLRQEGPWMMAIQSFSHGLLLRGQVMATLHTVRCLQFVLQGFLVRRLWQSQKQSACCLQAGVRGRLVRRRSGMRLEVHRRTLRGLPTSPGLTLGHRMLSGLASLASARSMSPILSACVHLEAATRLSSSCCLMLLHHSAVSTLLTVIGSCNRSLPSLQVTEMALSIFRNIQSHGIASLHAVFVDEPSFLWHVLNVVVAQKDYAVAATAGHEVQHKIFILGTQVLAGVTLTTPTLVSLDRLMDNPAEFRVKLHGLIKFLEKKKSLHSLPSAGKKKLDATLESSLHTLQIASHHIEQLAR